MAQIQDSSDKKEKHKLQHQPRRTGSCFLGCFGSSVSPSEVKEKSRKRSSTTTIVSWLSWSRKSPKRTVPVDAATTSEKLHQSKESFLMAKSNNKVLTKTPKLPADGTAAAPGQTPASTIGGTVVQGKKIKTRYENAQKIILENTKNLNHLDSIMKETTSFKKGASKRNSSRNDTSSPPEDKHEVSQRATAVLSHSSSMPPPSLGKKPVAKGGDGASQVKKVKSHEKNDNHAGRFDSFVGMSIVLVTLIIMIVWGKLCAILCTSACLYCYPLIKAKKIEPKVTKRNGSKSFDVDINSEEYKKKVVLEGFLDRNHRNNGVGFL